MNNITEKKYLFPFEKLEAWQLAKEFMESHALMCVVPLYAPIRYQRIGVWAAQSRPEDHSSTPLQAWSSVGGTKHTYSVTNHFPAEEKYGLARQLNRAAISVASNLAEGSARMSLKDQAHFSQLAYGSLMEVICQLVIALELGFLEQAKYDELRHEAALLSSKINALRRSQKERMS